jgi:Cu/Ag efflux protein CusF
MDGKGGIDMNGIARFAGACGLALLLACGGGTPGEGHGTIRGVDAARGEVTIEHGDIPGVMKAMTMTFHAESPGLLEGLAPDQEVDFHVREEAGGRYVLTRIVPSP